MTTAEADANNGVQAGVVVTATNTSPGLSLLKSPEPNKTQAGADTAAGTHTFQHHRAAFFFALLSMK